MTEREMIEEAADVRVKASEWIDVLIASGVEEKVIVSGLLVAATDRVIGSGGIEEAARWLKLQADNLAKIQGG